jgi:NADH-quinone oxidoreductase subunit C
MSHSLEDLAGQLARWVQGPGSLSAGDATAETVAPPPVQTFDFAARGVNLDVTLTPDQVVGFAEIMDREGFSIDTVTGVDWLPQEQMEVVYDFFHPHKNWRVASRTRVPRTNPEVATISGVFPGANWHERETHEFLGIRFVGHPNLIPLLLPEDSVNYHPLRKDFVA